MLNSQNTLLSITKNFEYSTSLISTQAHELIDTERERARYEQLVNQYFLNLSKCFSS